MDVHIVDDFTGAQYGTKGNPYACKTSDDFDARLRAMWQLDDITLHLNGDKFYSVATPEWSDTNDVLSNPGWRFGRRWKMVTETQPTIVWDVDKVEPTNVPLALVRTIESRFISTTLSGEQCWALRPSGQLVRGIKFDLQFSRAIDKWRAAGMSLQIGVGALGGDGAAFENCPVTNYGAWNAETFPFYIQGAYSKWERDLISRLDATTHIYDRDLSDEQCAHITNCAATGYCADSNDQVTVRYIAGSIGNPSPDAWAETMRRHAYQYDSDTTVPDVSNKVQPHCIYQSLSGHIAHNRATNTACGIYGDSYTTKGLSMEFNEFLNVYYGIQLQLSPGKPGDALSLAQAAQFSHEAYKIGVNKIVSRAENVLLDPMGAQTATRFMRNFEIDSTLSVRNNGATDVRRTGELATRRGCKFF
jgi:hypothetical protein